MYDPLKGTLKKKQKIVLCIRDFYDISKFLPSESPSEFPEKA